jgi:hypothetical protein
VSEETRLVVSEPLGDLAGAWNEVPESSYGVVHHGHDEPHPFRPDPCQPLLGDRAHPLRSRSYAKNSSAASWSWDSSHVSVSLPLRMWITSTFLFS